MSAFEIKDGVCIIPSSVTEIGSYAFSGCSSLKEIVIPSSVTEIGSCAFENCSGLEKIVVEDGNPKYDSREGCNAVIETSTNELIDGCKTTIIPSSVTGIGYDAFKNCSSLTEIVIPSSVTEIGYYAFESCSGLEKIVVEEGNPIYDSREGCNAIIETATNKLIRGCKNTIIPSSVAEIGKEAFLGCSGLTEIVIPEGVREIGSKVFYDCSSLEKIVIPSSVTEIGEKAFKGCSSLKDIVIPSSVTKIRSSAFERSSLTVTLR